MSGRWLGRRAGPRSVTTGSLLWRQPAATLMNKSASGPVGLISPPLTRFKVDCTRSQGDFLSTPITEEMEKKEGKAAAARRRGSAMEGLKKMTQWCLSDWTWWSSVTVANQLLLLLLPPSKLHLKQLCTRWTVGEGRV